MMALMELVTEAEVPWRTNTTGIWPVSNMNWGKSYPLKTQIMLNQFDVVGISEFIQLGMGYFNYAIQGTRL